MLEVPPLFIFGFIFVNRTAMCQVLRAANSGLVFKITGLVLSGLSGPLCFCYMVVPPDTFVLVCRGPVLLDVVDQMHWKMKLYRAITITLLSVNNTGEELHHTAQMTFYCRQ